MRIRWIIGAVVVLVSLVFAVTACGGEGDSAASAETETAVTDETAADESTVTDETASQDATVDTETTEPEAETSDNSATTGPAPAPGTGMLELDDGRTFAITVTECSFQPESSDSPAAGRSRSRERVTRVRRST